MTVAEPTILPPGTSAHGIGRDELAAIARALVSMDDLTVKTYNAGPAGGGELSYVDARDVQAKLDRIVGPFGWEDEYEVVNPATGAVKCTLTILGISRQDVGYPNNPIGAVRRVRNRETDEFEEKRIDSDEPLKEAVTDAFKRAAVHFGVARALYGHDAPKGQPSERKDGRGVPRPASDAQIKYLHDLCRQHRVPEPNGGDFSALPGDVARAWISALKEEGPGAQLTGWPDAGRTAARVVDTTTGDIVDGGGGEQEPDSGTHRTGLPKASPYKPASANQLATIAKLARLLGQPDPGGEDMTAAEASDRITELSRLYNERKSTVTRG